MSESWGSRCRAFTDALAAESVLKWLFEPASEDPKLWPPDRCPGCGEPAENPKSPYCGERCREVSAFVRQVRAAIAKGNPTADRITAMEQVYWHLLGGGYPRRIAEIPPSTIAKVLSRDDHRCHRCGGSADQIEHLRTACNRPINLGAVCHTCRTVRPMGDFDVIHGSERLRTEIAARVCSEAVARRCDDPERWDWRAFLAERTN